MAYSWNNASSPWKEYMGYTIKGQENPLNRVSDFEFLNYQKGFAQQDMFSSIFDSLGGIFGKLQQQQQAQDYYDKVQAARMQAYENARVVGEAQKQSNTMIADFNAKLYNRTANYLSAYADNQMGAAKREHEKGIALGQKYAGNAENMYASSGVDIGSGSARDAVNQVINYEAKDTQNRWTDRLSQIQGTLAKVAENETNAEYVKWEATEKNRFVDAQIQQQLFY